MGYIDSFKTKVGLIHKALKELQGEKEIVLFVNGYNTVFINDLDEIESRFRTMNKSWLFAAGRHCACQGLVNKHPLSKTPYRFLNSGLWIANVSYALDHLEGWIDRIPNESSDQDFFTKAYLSDTSVLALDYDCEIFQTLWEAETDISMSPQGLYNNITRRHPCVLHGDGYSKTSLAKLWDEGLFYCAST